MNEIDQIKAALRSVLQAMVNQGSAITPEQRQSFTELVLRAQDRILSLRNEPIPQGAEQLWTLAGGNRQAFQNYIQNVPNRSLNQLEQSPVQLRNIEDRLDQRITFPAGQVEDGIPKAQLQSSNVYGFSYNPKDSKLFVRFQGGGVYEYENVPPLAFKIFQQGAIPAKTKGQNQYGRWWIGKKPSLGASFFRIIRDNFPYHKVA